jgi:hypothetical protein
MPPLTDEQTRRNVIRQWISGVLRDTIAEENNIGAGTVSSIVASYKVGLEELDFNSIRQLAVEARQHGLNLSELASHFRLYNYFLKSGAAEERIESFIAKVNSSDLSPEKVIEYVNQIHEIANEESIPLDQVSAYIREKLEEKQNIDEQIKEADATLQNKNVTIQAVNEHVKLKEELEKQGLSIDDIGKLLNLLGNAKRYGFDGKEIASKLYNIQELEWKEKQLKDKCKKLLKGISKYKDVVPLTEEIAALQIGIDELIALKAGINQAAKLYNLPPLTATLRLIDEIKKYNKIHGLKKELSALSLQKFAINEACSSQSQALATLLKLQSHGITEDKILELNNLLENNRYNVDVMYSS